MKNSQNGSSKTSSLTSRGKVLSAVLLTLFLNLFLFHRIGSVATVLVLGSYYVFASVAFLNRALFKNNQLLHLGLIAINLLFSLSILTVDNSFSRTVVIFSWFISTSYAVYLFLENKPFFSDLEEMILVPVNLGISYVISGLSVVGKILLGQVDEFLDLGERPKLPFNALFRILIGGAISLPVIAILTLLLSSGDPVFAYKVTRVFQEIGKIFDIKFWFEPIAHVVFSVFIFVAVLPLALIKLRKIPIKYLPDRLPLGTEVAVLLGLVTLVLGAFLIVDFPYVFANVAETSLIKYGVHTYSEYVKRGFFEFSLVSVVVYGVLWGGLGAIRGLIQDQKSKIKIVLTVFQSVLFVEFGIFLLSIFRRIFLYQQFHGWSLARIYGGIFLVWVLGLVAILAVRHFYQKSLLLAEVLLTVTVIIFVGLFNSENFIATSHPPTVNKRIDYVYLSRMSTDGTAGWKMSYENALKILGQNLKKEKQVGCKQYFLESEEDGKQIEKCAVADVQIVIDKDNRREIAYAGVAISNLLRNYHELVREYGSVSEVSDYLRAVVAQNIVSDFEYEQRLQERVSALEVNKDESNASYWRKFEETNQAEIKNLRLVQGRIGKSVEEDSRLFDEINVESSYPGKGFDADPSVPNFYYFNYQPNSSSEVGNSSKRTFGWVDYLFNWNNSRSHAYLFLKNEIGIGNLIKLQNTYFLRGRFISNQPANEKDFDIDISTDSPLIFD